MKNLLQKMLNLHLTITLKISYKYNRRIGKNGNKIIKLCPIWKMDLVANIIPNSLRLNLDIKAIIQKME